MNILSFLKNNWRLLSTLILLFIIWAEYSIIIHRENTILKLNNDIEQLNIAINAKDISIESYKKATADYDAKIDSINDARLARVHNDANVIAMSSTKPMFIVKDMLDAFLGAKPSTVKRYKDRNKMIDSYKN